MTERPILFKDRLVRAILEGSKTQTRRVVQPQPHPDKSGPGWSWDHRKGSSQLYFGAPNRDQMLVHAPFRVGQTLWVREAWADDPDDFRVAIHRSDWTKDDSGERRGWWGPNSRWFPGDVRWKPSIHMPRTACRLRLEVTEVRVQRLQDISNEDASAEGVERIPLPLENAGWVGADGVSHSRARDAFASLWDSINAARGFAWHANPWVWAITFRRLP